MERWFKVEIDLGTEAFQAEDDGNSVELAGILRDLANRAARHGFAGGDDEGWVRSSGGGIVGRWSVTEGEAL